MIEGSHFASSETDAKIRPQLRGNHPRGAGCTRRIDQRCDVVPAPVFGDQGEKFLHDLGRMHREIRQNYAKHAPLAKPAANIARIEEDPQRRRPVLGEGTNKAPPNLLLVRSAQRPDRSKQVEAVGTCACKRCRIVFRARERLVILFFQ